MIAIGMLRRKTAESVPLAFLGEFEFQPGDVIAFSGTSCVSRTIQFCTLGSISHVAIIAPHPVPGRGLRLYESLLPDGVRGINPGFRIKSALLSGTRVWRYPLAKPLSEAEAVALSIYCEAAVGIPYDRLGAMAARSLGLGWVRWTRAYNWLPNREDTGTLFCSETVAVAERYVDRFYTRNASKWSPVNLCWALVERGHCPGAVELELPE